MKLVVVFVCATFLALSQAQVLNTGEVVLHPPPGSGNTRFGWSISSTGNIIANGAPNFNEDGKTHVGRTFVFEKNTSSGFWTEIQQLRPSDPTPGGHFGYSVLTSDLFVDAIFVGAEGDYYARPQDKPGGVYIFQRNLDSSSQLYTEVGKIVADVPGNGLFGYSMSLSQTTLAVGAVNSGDGAVFLYELSFGDEITWTQKLVLEGDVGSDRFGRSVFITDDLLAIGCTLDNPVDLPHFAGAVYLYEKVADFEWTRTTILLPLFEDGSSQGEFGMALSISADQTCVAIGASGGNSFDVAAGAVYLFSKMRDVDDTSDTSDTWVSTQVLHGSDSEKYDDFGSRVVFYENYLFVGASGPVSMTGAVYVFQKLSGDWKQTQKVSPSSLHTLDMFGGYSIAAEEDSLIVGAIGHDLNLGAVYIFELQ